jgi:ketosteroid isomerase-like protein
MAQEPTTPDLDELTRRAFEVAKSHDLDAIMSFFAPDAVWDLSDLGLEIFEGAAAIRRFLEEWFGTFEDHRADVEEIFDLGSGVVFSRVREEGRLVGSGGRVEQHRGWVVLWVRGEIVRGGVYLAPDEARAAAERLAEERG